MPKLGINRDDLKKTNRGLVLKLVATGKATSRIELANQTGLTKTAISQIVSSLIRSGYLREVEKQMIREIGRKPIGLAISENAPVFVGVLIQRGYAEAVLCDMTLQILEYKRVEKSWKNGSELLETVYEMIDYMIGIEKNVRSIGISSIGSIDVKSGRLVRPLYFNGIRDVDITAPISDRYGLPVFFDHDNQSAVIAERLFGNGQNCKDILFVGIGSGVGCGIIIDDKRYQSGTGYAPEIGHISIDYQGELCICGCRGCLETYLATPFVLKRMREKTGYWDWNYASFLSQSDMSEIDEIMCDIVNKLAAALISSINILNPQLIILGLDSTLWPDRYIMLLEEKVNALKFNMQGEHIYVKKPFFLEKTHVLGAACNAVTQIFTGELL